MVEDSNHDEERYQLRWKTATTMKRHIKHGGTTTIKRDINDGEITTTKRDINHCFTARKTIEKTLA